MTFSRFANLDSFSRSAKRFRMTDTDPVTVICKFVVKPGKEEEMKGLLAKHWPTLHRLGMTTDEPARVYQGVAAPEGERSHDLGANVFVEIFSWKDRRQSSLAHQSPDVLPVWEPMGAICEHMEFPHFERVEL